MFARRSKIQNFVVQGFFGCELAIEEEDVGLDALGVEDICRQAEQSVNVGLFE
jgi:hypothetical protein